MKQNPTTGRLPTPPMAGRAATALLAALAMAGCVPLPVAPPAATAPVAAAPVPQPASPTTPRVVAPSPVTAAPVEPAKPAAPVYSGGIDGRTGMRQASVVAVTGDGTRGYTVLFRPKDTEPASVESVPGKLCGASGVASSRTNAPGSGSAMPGVQIMIVKCNTAV